MPEAAEPTRAHGAHEPPEPTRPHEAPGPPEPTRPQPGRASAQPHLPYTRHHLDPSDESAVLEALRSGRIAQGPEVNAFEAELAGFCGAPHCAVVSSGTTALELALAALGVGPGDEVIVPTLTFVATANAVAACGARPVFADVCPDTLNLDPASVSLHRSPRTRGAVAVHYAGHAADVPALRQTLGEDAFVLEDAAHALGARSPDGPVGTLGDAATFSFHPAKLVTCGEGGAVVSRHAELVRDVRRLREHGLERDAARFGGLGLPERLKREQEGAWVYEMSQRGSNARLSEPAAALGRSQLQRAHGFLAERRRLAARYTEALASVAGVATPVELPGHESAWHLYPVRLLGARPDRRSVYDGMHRRGIGVQVHYVPVHLQPAFRRDLLTRFGDQPVAEDAYLRLLSLPLFPGLGDAGVERVVTALCAALAEAGR